jgi:membrane protease YdiL (CAAX protease family)
LKTNLISLFWNSTERRLRAFWRLLVQGSLWFGLQIGISVVLVIVIVVVSMVTGELPVQEFAGSYDQMLDLMSRPGVTLILQISTLLITVGCVWLAGRFLDRRKFSDFGFHISARWWLDLGFGLMLGAVLMAGLFLLELAAGWITVEDYLVTRTPGELFPLAILTPVILFICVGITEELASRGYQLKNMAEGMKGTRFGAGGAIFAATIISSILFGLMHGANPNITLIAILNLMMAGVFLALGYILTGELAVPIGLHISWNFFQGNVFGFPVSGLDPVAAQFVSIRQGGPEWLTGGAFGPEGGLVGLGAMAAGCLLIFLWVKLTREKIALAAALAEYEGKETKTTK